MGRHVFVGLGGMLLEQSTQGTQDAGFPSPPADAETPLEERFLLFSVIGLPGLGEERTASSPVCAEPCCHRPAMGRKGQLLMARRSRIDFPRRVESRRNLTRKFHLVARSLSQPVSGKRRAALPARSRTGEGDHNPMVERKYPSSARAGRDDDGSHGITAMAGAACLHSETATAMRNIRDTPQSLEAKATSSASLMKIKRALVLGDHEPNLMTKREASSPAGVSAVAAKAATSQHKNMELFTEKWESGSCHPMAKAGAAYAARMSRSSVERNAEANSGFAADHISHVGAAVSPDNEGKKRRRSLMFIEPWWAPLQKKAKREPWDARRAVQERLGVFREFARTLQREKSTKPDLQALTHLKGRGIVPTRRYLGEVPGVEVGDEFHYRSELMVAGLHGSPMNGIDSMPFEGRKVATCVISSKGGYINIMEGSDVLVYSGEGGNPTFESARKEPPGDQRLDRGNLALKNSLETQKPVRVVHGFTVPRDGAESLESEARTVVKYVYDGLYLVEDFWWETGRLGFRVLKFQMRRMPGQRKLELKQVRRVARIRLRQCADVEEGDSEAPWNDRTR